MVLPDDGEMIHSISNYLNLQICTFPFFNPYTQLRSILIHFYIWKQYKSP